MAVTVTLMVALWLELTTVPSVGFCVINVPLQLSVAVPNTFGIVTEQFPSKFTSWSAPCVNTGAVISLAVKTTVFTSVKPAPSVAVTVTLIIALWLDDTTVPAVGFCAMVVPLQLSVAVPNTFGMVTSQLASKFTFWFAPCVNIGAVKSFAVNTTVSTSVKPAPSVAVTVTLIVALWPELTTVPAVGFCVITVPLQLSVAVPNTFGMITEQLPFRLTFWSAPAVKIGASLSIMVTVNVVVAAGAQPLTAVRVTVVTPLLNVSPLPVPLPLPVVAPVNT